MFISILCGKGNGLTSGKGLKAAHRVSGSQSLPGVDWAVEPSFCSSPSPRKRPGQNFWAERSHHHPSNSKCGTKKSQWDKIQEPIFDFWGVFFYRICLLNCRCKHLPVNKTFHFRSWMKNKPDRNLPMKKSAFWSLNLVIPMVSLTVASSAFLTSLDQTPSTNGARATKLISKLAFPSVRDQGIAWLESADKQCDTLRCKGFRTCRESMSRGNERRC